MDEELVNGSLPDREHAGGTESGKLIQAAPIGLTVNGPCAEAAQEAKRAGVDGEEGFIKDASELEVGDGGIQERPEDIKNGGRTLCGESLPDGHNGLEGRVVVRGKEEETTRLVENGSGTGGGVVDANTEGLKDIGAAAL